MYDYSIAQWLFFFYFYCFFGWCFESAVVSLRKKKFVNRGFMKGPFLPLYGFGAIIMLVVSAPYKENIVLVFISGLIGATILEYITGVTMEALFKVRYWDYSDDPFNFQGQICLSSSLAWGGLTILMTEVVHKRVEHFGMMIPDNILTIVTLIITIWIAGDFTLAFKSALDLKNVLMKLEKAKEDIAVLQKRLDVVIAVADDEIKSRREDRKKNIEEFKKESEEKRKAFKEKLDMYKNNSNFLRHQASEKINKLTRSNPSMRSRKFKEVFEEIKKHINDEKKLDL